MSGFYRYMRYIYRTFGLVKYNETTKYVYFRNLCPSNDKYALSFCFISNKETDQLFAHVRTSLDAHYLRASSV